MTYVNSYFAQGDDASEALDAIDEHGVENWLNMMSGAIDFTEGETSDEPPWGSSDACVFCEDHGDNGLLFVHMNNMGYVSITLKCEE